MTKNIVGSIEETKLRLSDALEKKKMEEEKLLISELLVNNLKEQVRKQEEIERLSQSLIEMQEEEKELKEKKDFDSYPLFHKKEKAYVEYMNSEAT